MLINFFSPQNYLPIHKRNICFRESYQILQGARDSRQLKRKHKEENVCIKNRDRGGKKCLFQCRFLKENPPCKFLFECSWITSTHSVDPNKPNSSASQLANITVLLGLHPGMKDHENCITKIKATCYTINVKTHGIFGSLIFYHDLWGKRYT